MATAAEILKTRFPDEILRLRADLTRSLEEPEFADAFDEEFKRSARMFRDACAAEGVQLGGLTIRTRSGNYETEIGFVSVQTASSNQSRSESVDLSKLADDIENPSTAATSPVSHVTPSAPTIRSL